MYDRELYDQRITIRLAAMDKIRLEQQARKDGGNSTDLLKAATTRSRLLRLIEQNAFDIRLTSLSTSSRQRLANILASCKRHTASIGTKRTTPFNPSCTLPFSPDTSLRSFTQWKRAPWGLRRLDKDSTVLGLPKGTVIPQLVINENIRTRACRSCEDFLVPADLEAPHVSSTRSRNRQAPITAEDHHEILGKLTECCRDEWGDFPQPVSVGMERGQWIVHFRNHPNDKNPSTVVMGDFSKLLLQGAHSFSRDFNLPNELSADELCESFIAGPETRPENKLPHRSIAAPFRGKMYFLDGHFEGLESFFAQPIASRDRTEIVSTLRQRLNHVIVQGYFPDDHILIRSAEGIGKTSNLMSYMAGHMFDAACNNYVKERFACFAFCSIEQASAKADEFCDKYRRAVILRSFWEHYRAACDAAGSKPIPRNHFPVPSLNGILDHIRTRQPSTFTELEKRRKGLWKATDGKDLYDSATTALFTSHALAKRWHTTQITRRWHHAEFEPFADDETVQTDIFFSHIVFDEPEIDRIIYRIPEPIFDWLKRVKRLNPNWKKKKRKERVAIYESEKAAKLIPGDHTFEECDEWLRVPLSRLERWEVDYEAIPFGYDAPGRGMYAAWNGKRFYLGVQRWLKDCKAQIIFLTTESVISLVLISAYQKLAMNLQVLDLHAECDLFPIAAPVIIDKRVAKTKITALAETILAENPNSTVIGNGIKVSDPRVKTFARAKGLNGIEQKDIFILPTFLAADQYAELNVIGQWLKLPGVITCFYEDQISQAVGRNQGFRKTGEGSVTVICSSRLYKNALAKCFQHHSSRVRLTKTKKIRLDKCQSGMLISQPPFTGPVTPTSQPKAVTGGLQG